MTQKAGQRSPKEGSARIEALQLEIAKRIPLFPNNRDSLCHLQQKQLPAILVDYVNWRSRFVGTRPRSVEIELGAQADQRWEALADQIGAFLKKVEQGCDLTPHLSLAARTRGYSPTASAAGPLTEDRWLDKDMVLNTLAYHHFHIGTDMQKRGHMGRSSNLIFAHVSHDHFKVAGLFSHEVFEPDSLERKRLRCLHHAIQARNVPPGSFVVMGGVATSGHNARCVRYAQCLARSIRAIDTQMNDNEKVEAWFKQKGLAVPSSPRFKWILTHLDLGFRESTTGAEFWCVPGWN